MLAPLDNDTVFKRAFSDRGVCNGFVADLAGIKADFTSIATDKQWKPDGVKYDFAPHITAEASDKRCITYLHHFELDVHLEQFVQTFLSACSQAQPIVCAIAVVTSPFIIKQQNGQTLSDNFLLLSPNPFNSKGVEVRLWSHKLIIVNTSGLYKETKLPSNIATWLQLFDTSINAPETYKPDNITNPTVQRAAELIQYERLDAATLDAVKQTLSRKTIQRVAESQAYEKGLLSVARNMKQSGYSVFEIQKLTGLSADEIAKL